VEFRKPGAVGAANRAGAENDDVHVRTMLSKACSRCRN
jgi:hypothetical protein